MATSLAQSDATIGLVGQNAKFVSATPVVSNGVAYTAGDQVGGVQTIAGALRQKRGDKTNNSAYLQTITMLDKADQAAAQFDIMFFNASPTVASTDNGAIDITDAEVLAKCIGTVTIATTDWVDTGNQKVATKNNIGLLIEGDIVDIYALAITRGTPTYGSTSDLVFRYGFEQH